MTCCTDFKPLLLPASSNLLLPWRSPPPLLFYEAALLIYLLVFLRNPRFSQVPHLLRSRRHSEKPSAAAPRDYTFFCEGMEKLKRIIKASSNERRVSRKREQKERLSIEDKKEVVEGSFKKRRSLDEGSEIKEEAAVSNKKAKTKTPFKVAPSSYRADVFHIVHPFVLVISSKHRKLVDAENKVQDGQAVEQHALQAVAKIVSTDYVHMSMCSKSKKTELGYRPMHNALASGFYRLTRPNSKPEISLKELFKPREPGSPSAQPDNDEDLHDLELDVNEAVATNDEHDEDKSSTESLHLHFEEGDQDESANKNNKFDICFRVVDKKVDGIDDNVVVLVVECKMGTITLENIYQVAAYAIEFGKENLKKGRDAPLYLEVWNEAKWRYAILYPQGMVCVQENKVVTTSARAPISACQETLDDSLGKLWVDCPEANYPNGDYLQGLLYIVDEEFLLPDPMEDKGLVQPGPLRFFQSMLRIIVGDRVLKWTEEDVHAAADIRNQRLAEKMKKLSY